MKSMVPPGSADRAGGAIHQASPMVPCDLCGWPMPVPINCIESREITGLLTCSECVEDALAARQLETQS